MPRSQEWVEVRMAVHAKRSQKKSHINVIIRQEVARRVCARSGNLERWSSPCYARIMPSAACYFKSAT